MKIAPLQPQAIVFENVLVQTVRGDDQASIEAQNFDFQGVNISCDVGHGSLESQGSTTVNDTMLVRIDFRIDNESGKIAPYKIHISAMGIFKWLDMKISDEVKTDLMVVNGASMLYGAIRELVLSLTSRSIAGALLLPSFNFQDNRPSLNRAEVEVISVKASSKNEQ